MPSDATPGFVFLADHPAVDLVNTRYAPEGEMVDAMPDWAAVMRWMENTGLAKPADLRLSTSEAVDGWKYVATLRADWAAQVERIVAGEGCSSRFVTTLNGILATQSFTEKLVKSGEGGLELVREPWPLKGGELALSVMSRQIADFLAHSEMSYLRQCAAHDCVLYFYDTTKNHRRQWCSATMCGNRHKVAAFRQRKAAGKGSSSV